MHEEATDRPATLGFGAEPGPLTAQEQAEFFQRPLLARVAAVAADGAPYVVPLWFLWECYASRAFACQLPMTQRYIGQLDTGYIDRTADFPRWLERVTPYRMTTWRGGGWSRYYFA